MWVVDTCVIIDILENDSMFGLKSAQCLQSKLEEGLVVSPITYVELAPAFIGDRVRQDEFFNRMLVDCKYPWDWDDTRVAHNAWARYVQLKRSGKTHKRPVADIMIGAFATKFRGLVTRNERDFRDIFPELEIINPVNIRADL